MLTIKFFSLIREALNVGELTLEWSDELATVAHIKHHLVERHGEPWREVLFQPNVVHAVNQTVVHDQTPLKRGDEIAFFPPMTGG